MKIEKNTVVSLEFELCEADGTVLEKSEEPMEYLHGGYSGMFDAVANGSLPFDDDDIAPVYMSERSAVAIQEWLAANCGIDIAVGRVPNPLPQPSVAVTTGTVTTAPVAAAPAATTPAG